MAFGFLWQKKPTLKLMQSQTVELEFENPEGEYENYFANIALVDRKKVTLEAPEADGRPIRLVPGQPVTISIFDEERDVFFSYGTSVLDSREQDFDVAPPKDADCDEVPPRDDSFRVEVPIQVEYRAMTTHHFQVATTHAITPNGLFLLTNLPIPPGTPLRLKLKLPNSPDIEAQGQAVTSQTDKGTRKHVAEVEYEEITERDKQVVLRYAVYYRQRQRRKDQRDAEEQATSS